MTAPPATPRPVQRTRARLRGVVAVATAGWALMHLVAGAAWAAGTRGYPFVAEPEDPFPSLLASVSADLVAPAIATVGAAVGVAVVVGRRVRGRVPAAVAAGVLWLAAATALLVVPDVGLLATVAYTPLLLLGAPFGWPEGAALAAAWSWPLAYQALSVAGGLVWVAAALHVQRRAAGACPRCGRGAPPARWAHPDAAARWGRWAVGVAVAVPVFYAATRFAWALGVPLGISGEVLREGRETGLWMTGAALGALAVVGAGITLGLAQRWGEVVPGWLPLVGGRTVPPAMATVPAFVVAVLVTSAGLQFVRLHAVGAFDDFFAGDSWAVIGPELLWPLWGVALAAAALAYHVRRRGPCPACGAGVPSVTGRR